MISDYQTNNQTQKDTEMSNDLAIQNMRDSLKKYRREMPVTVGSINFMKFSGKSGEWTYGKDRDEVDTASTFIVAAESLGHGYMAFDEAANKVEHEVKRKIYQALPEISDLPNAENEYRFQVGMTMAGASGKEKGKTFQLWGNSKGLIAAHTALVQQIEDQLDKTETAVNPIIKLSEGNYRHSNPKYGKIYFPVFEVVGWSATLGGDETPEADEPEADEPEADEPEADEPEADEVAALKAKLAALEAAQPAEETPRRRRAAPKV